MEDVISYYTLYRRVTFLDGVYFISSVATIVGCWILKTNNTIMDCNDENLFINILFFGEIIWLC